MLNCLRLIQLSSVVVAFVGAAAESSSNGLYLKEILQGRCYDVPPVATGSHNSDTGIGVSACPAIVGSLMNILESHLDANIQPSDFEEYLVSADLSSPPDHATFFLRFYGETPSKVFTPPPGFVTPEDTPGGALMRDLVFCGIDQRNNCSVETSNAYWSFWQAAYAKFASQVSGHVQIVIENEYADVQFLLRSAIKNLQATAVDSVTIYGGGGGSGCSSNQNVAKLTDAIVEAGINTESIACKDDIAQFYMDNRDDSLPNGSGSSKPISIPATKHDQEEAEDTTSEQHGEAEEESISKQDISSDTEEEYADTHEAESHDDAAADAPRAVKHHSRHGAARIIVTVLILVIIAIKLVRLGKENDWECDRWIPRRYEEDAARFCAFLKRQQEHATEFILVRLGYKDEDLKKDDNNNEEEVEEWGASEGAPLVKNDSHSDQGSTEIHSITF